MKFAKLFETEEYGQILFLLETDVEGSDGIHPVAITMKVAPEGLGVCSLVFGYKEEKLDKAESVFESIDEEEAKKLASSLFTQLKEAGL